MQIFAMYISKIEVLVDTDIQGQGKWYFSETLFSAIEHKIVPVQSRARPDVRISKRQMSALHTRS